MRVHFAILIAALGFTALSQSRARSAAAPNQAPVFRGGVDLVNIGVTVTDNKGRLVDHLTSADFSLLEDGKPQTIRLFAAGEGPGPALHVGILLDVSESMEEDIAFTRTAAIKFLNTLTEAVDITLVDFDTQVRAARYDQSNFARVVERIRQQKPQGDTALYDAIGVYLDGASDQDGRKVMLLYTDGSDTRSVLSLHELLNLLKASDATVYAIGALGHARSGLQGEAQLVLRQIADVTGGAAFFPESADALDRIYQQVVAEIHAQYTIGYLSTNERADGAWRKVEVQALGSRSKEVRVRSRKGYFARRVIQEKRPD